MNSQSLVAIWNMIWELVGNIRVPSGKTPSQLRTDPEIQMSLINSSRSHLELEYFNFIQETVNSNLRDANRGAMPGTEQLIRSFLQVRKVCFFVNSWIYFCFSTIIKLRRTETSGQWSSIACVADRQRYFNRLLWFSQFLNLDSSWNRAQKLANRRWIPAKPGRLGRVTRPTSRTESRVKDQDPVQTLCSCLYWPIQARRLLHCWQVRHGHSRGRYPEDRWLLMDEIEPSCCWKGMFIG